MSLRQISPEWKHVSTYATEANLQKRIAEERDLYPDHDDRFLVVRTPEGRWTAVVVLDRASGGYIGRYSFLKV